MSEIQDKEEIKKKRKLSNQKRISIVSKVEDPDIPE
jgi:hypothetical protein